MKPMSVFWVRIMYIQCDGVIFTIGKPSVKKSAINLERFRRVRGGL